MGGYKFFGMGGYKFFGMGGYKFFGMGCEKGIHGVGLLVAGDFVVVKNGSREEDRVYDVDC